MTQSLMSGPLVTVESIFQRSRGNIRFQKHGRHLEMHFRQDSVTMHQSRAENGLCGSSRKALFRRLMLLSSGKQEKQEYPCHELKT